MLNKKLIKKLRNGEICIELKHTDGRHKKKLNKVLKKAFPDDGAIAKGEFTFYHRDTKYINIWSVRLIKPENLKPVKLKKFFK